ncbi:hypothetical protein Aduo_000431 [Ancylostoma duodenale]
MNEYDCHGIGQDAVLSVYCTTKQFNPASGNSLNHKEYSLDFTPANALQQAISEWYGELKEVDLDDKATYNDQIKTKANSFANMAVAQATKFAYTARQCRPEGYTVAVCQYNRPPIADSPLYEVGKPCAGCDKAKTTCDQVDGLCVTK